MKIDYKTKQNLRKAAWKLLSIVVTNLAGVFGLGLLFTTLTDWLETD
jgi:hypothetical protein